MKITFDKSADALYIELKQGKAKKTIAKANVLGFEILRYSKNGPAEERGSITITGKKKLALPIF